MICFAISSVVMLFMPDINHYKYEGTIIEVNGETIFTDVPGEHRMKKYARGYVKYRDLHGNIKTRYYDSSMFELTLDKIHENNNKYMYSYRWYTRTIFHIMAFGLSWFLFMCAYAYFYEEYFVRSLSDYFSLSSKPVHKFFGR